MDKSVVYLAGRSVVTVISWLWCCIGGRSKTGRSYEGNKFLVSCRGSGSAEGSIPIPSENYRSLGTENREKAKKILQAVVIFRLLVGGWEVDVDDN